MVIGYSFTEARTHPSSGREWLAFGLVITAFAGVVSLLLGLG